MKDQLQEQEAKKFGFEKIGNFFKKDVGNTKRMTKPVRVHYENFKTKGKTNDGPELGMA